MGLFALALVGAAFASLIALWRQPTLPRAWMVLSLAAAPQVLLLLGVRFPGMYLITGMVALMWCLMNRQLPGALVVAVGIGLNLVVMAYHGGAMPIRSDVIKAIGESFDPGTALVTSKDTVVHSSPLWLLSDWIIIPTKPYPIVASPGDLLIIAGIIWWLFFSHQPAKDQAHADNVRGSAISGTTHTATSRPK